MRLLSLIYNLSQLTSLSVEMNTGILAASLPALRPLFAFLLETATAIKTSGLRGRSGPNSSRHRYYIQEDDIKLGSLPSRSTLSKHGYGVSVVGGKSLSDDESTIYRQRSATNSGPMSKLEQSLEEPDSGSEENILPLQNRAHLPRERDQRRGIMRTTEVMVSR